MKRSGRPIKLLFLAPGDVSKGRVEPISWMRTCAAFAARGLDVSLVTIRVRRPDGVAAKDVWRHFGVEPDFRVRVVPSVLRHDSSVAAFRLCAAAAGAVTAVVALGGQALRPRRLIVYARSPALLAPFVTLRRLLPRSRRPALVYETHTLPPPRVRRIVARADLVVVNSETLAGDLVRESGVPHERVLNVPLGPYNDIRPLAKAGARADLGLAPDAVIGCYSGKLVAEQTEFLLQAAGVVTTQLPAFRLLLVGGNPDALSWTEERARALRVEDGLILAGFVAPAQVHTYQAAADVLVFHMTPSLEHFEYCTPAKGYEYQAAGRPIVASDIPLFEEVFGHDGERAIRVTEKTPEALARGIVEALSLPDEGREMAARAVASMRGRTWQSRADAVLRALDL